MRRWSTDGSVAVDTRLPRWFAWCERRRLPALLLRGLYVVAAWTRG